MSTCLLNRERLNAAAGLAADVRAKYSGQSMRLLFTRRMVDHDLEPIGRELLGGAKADRVASHVLAWTGFEFVTNSRRLDDRFRVLGVV